MKRPIFFFSVASLLLVLPSCLGLTETSSKDETEAKQEESSSSFIEQGNNAVSSVFSNETFSSSRLSSAEFVSSSSIVVKPTLSSNQDQNKSSEESSFSSELNSSAVSGSSRIETSSAILSSEVKPSSSSLLETVLFSEDFEAATTSQWETVFEKEENNCTTILYGTATKWSSTDVDFQAVANSSSFIGINSVSPCGGWFSSRAVSVKLDLSGAADSLLFEADYIQTNALDWGVPRIKVSFDTGREFLALDANVFPAMNEWSSVRAVLPSSVMVKDIKLILWMVGEGVAMDNVKITRYQDTQILFDSTVQ